MIKLQVNIGDDLNQDQRDVTGEDFIIFSNGYVNVSSGYTGIKRIVHEFNEVDTPYAKYCHLLSNETIYQINYNGEKLYSAQQLFFSDPDSSTTMSRFSFRVIFIDSIVDQIKTPQIYTVVPEFFYSFSYIDTLITPFFYTTIEGISTNHVLEADGYKFIVTKVEQLSSYYKVQVRAYTGTDAINIEKSKYLIRDYNLPSTDTTLAWLPKIIFHDENISTQNIPNVDITSDITDTNLRTFRSTYEQANIDISNAPFTLDIDTTQDLNLEMYLADFTLTANIDTGNNSLHFITSYVTDIKKGDYILIKNEVYSEIFQITSINVSQNTYTVSRPFTKYPFLIGDSTIKAYQCRRIYFQPLALSFGENTVNYPVLFNVYVKHLNI